MNMNTCSNFLNSDETCGECELNTKACITCSNNQGCFNCLFLNWCDNEPAKTEKERVIDTALTLLRDAILN